MKKSLALLVFALTTTFFSSAQDKGDIEAGLNLGLNFSTVYNLDVPINTRISYNLGGSAEYYFSETWGIKAKLIYDRKGWADDFFFFEDTEEEFITDYALNYVTVPIMAAVHFGPRENFYLNFGPYIGFLTSAEAVVPSFDVSPFVNDTDFGFAFGFGYKFLLNKNVKMFFEFESQQGGNDIFIDNLGASVRNSRSSVNTGLLFLLY